MSTNLIL